MDKFSSNLRLFLRIFNSSTFIQSNQHFIHHPLIFLSFTTTNHFLFSQTTHISQQMINHHHFITHSTHTIHHFSNITELIHINSHKSFKTNPPSSTKNLNIRPTSTNHIQSKTVIWEALVHPDNVAHNTDARYKSTIPFAISKE